jgi:hypothetical protein
MTKTYQVKFGERWDFASEKMIRVWQIWQIEEGEGVQLHSLVTQNARFLKLVSNLLRNV